MYERLWFLDDPPPHLPPCVHVPVVIYCNWVYTSIFGANFEGLKHLPLVYAHYDNIPVRGWKDGGGCDMMLMMMRMMMMMMMMMMLMIMVMMMTVYNAYSNACVRAQSQQPPPPPPPSLFLQSFVDFSDNVFGG